MFAVLQTLSSRKSRGDQPPASVGIGSGRAFQTLSSQKAVAMQKPVV
ncbi:hypothetical protein H6F88_19170 [Oculatella sp. FACHB-28]|nr:hypothetical protein [Oculatella sp. FACHB-28]MBD1867717.1 hypothetical protein [Cyanobacteria bacterium FACHB-471]MBD2058107.1 hypothetical protein [Oculatella sp. FACHB-28]